MKRIVTVALAAILASLTLCSAQEGRLCVLGGISSPETDFSKISSSTISNYHAGVGVKVPLGFGFVLQPELTYSVKAVQNTDDLDIKCGYLEVPVQVQWGYSVSNLARIYAVAEPFLGYGVTNEITDNLDASVKNNWDYVNKLEYGLGVGAGVEVLDCVQLSLRYYWNYGSLYNGKEMDLKDAANTALDSFVTSFRDKSTFNGLSLTLAVLF